MQVCDKFNAVKCKINFTTITHEACIWLLVLMVLVGRLALGREELKIRK